MHQLLHVALHTDILGRTDRSWCLDSLEVGEYVHPGTLESKFISSIRGPGESQTGFFLGGISHPLPPPGPLPWARGRALSTPGGGIGFLGWKVLSHTTRRRRRLGPEIAIFNGFLAGRLALGFKTDPLEGGEGARHGQTSFFSIPCPIFAHFAPFAKNLLPPSALFRRRKQIKFVDGGGRLLVGWTSQGRVPV